MRADFSSDGDSAVPHRWRSLLLLVLVGLFNYMDRSSITILQVPIKAELGLGDAELGAITGLAFSLVYVLAALPLARLADHHSRRLVIAGCLLVWSVMTALCGTATGFWSLAVFRMGVAIGEAGCVPITQAVLADLFPQRLRGRVFALSQLILPVGVLLGVSIGGTLGAAVGWRNAFYILGGAGLVFAPVLHRLLVDSPVRARTTAAGGDRRGAADAVRAFWAIPSCRWLTIGGALLALPLQAMLAWNAPFYTRVFHLPLRDLALMLGMLIGVGGAIGVIGGGFLVDALARTDARWYPWLPAIAALFVPPFVFAQYRLAGDAWTSLLLGLVPIIALNGAFPCQAAAVQALVDPRDRAVGSSMLLIVSGLVGAAAGPLIAGVLSDALTPRWGAGALGIVLPLLSLCAIPGIACYCIAARSIANDVRQRQAAVAVA